MSVDAKNEIVVHDYKKQTEIQRCHPQGLCEMQIQRGQVNGSIKL